MQNGDIIFSLSKIIETAKKEYKILLCLTVTIFIVFTSLSIILPKKYESQVVIMPSADFDQPGVSGSVGTLASLVGVNLNSDGRLTQSIATLNSKKFTLDFINNNDLLPVLFEKKWDHGTGKWKTELEKNEIPSQEDIYRFFDKKVRTVYEDQRAGTIIIYINWKNAELSASWANALVDQLNQHIKNRDIQEAQESIKYLKKEIKKNKTIEINQILYQLIEHRIQKKTIAKTKQDYAFQVIDPAITLAEDEYIFPNHFVFGLIGLILGLGASLILVILRQYFQHKT